MEEWTFVGKKSGMYITITKYDEDDYSAWWHDNENAKETEGFSVRGTLKDIVKELEGEMRGFENFCKAYGVPEEIGAMIPTPEPQNTQIACKIEAINTCDRLASAIDHIKNMFKNAPVNDDVSRTKIMQEMINRLRVVDEKLSSVV